MPRAPQGSFKSVPDPAGELYDEQMAKIREQRELEDRGLSSPIDMVQSAFRDFQNGPDIPRPNLAESFIPVIGPAWEATADLQDGNYAGAAFNGAMAVVDLLPVGPAVKGARAAQKGVGILKHGSVSANASAKMLRARGFVEKGEEVHHTIPLKGKSRTAQDPRNHFALLKVMPQSQHRRLTGRWGELPKYNAVQRAWHGTNDWKKAVPAGVAGYVADTFENLTRPSSDGLPPAAKRR